MSKFKVLELKAVYESSNFEDEVFVVDNIDQSSKKSIICDFQYIVRSIDSYVLSQYRDYVHKICLNVSLLSGSKQSVTQHENIRSLVLVDVDILLDVGPTLVPLKMQGSSFVQSIREIFDINIPGVLTEIHAVLHSKPLQSNITTDIILTPWLASQFIHECIGHTSEADNYYNYFANYISHKRNARFCDVGYGMRWTGFPLNIVDDPTISNLRGSYLYDDQGNRSFKTTIVKNGKWNSLLYDNDTAKIDGSRSCNGRSVSKSKGILPRMSNTILLPGDVSLGQLIKSVREGFLVSGVYVGGSFGPNFILRPVFGQKIKNGKLEEEYIRRFEISGEKLDIANKIRDLSDETHLFSPVYGCNKDGHDQLPISSGSPHIRIADISLKNF